MQPRRHLLDFSEWLLLAKKRTFQFQIAISTSENPSGRRQSSFISKLGFRSDFHLKTSITADVEVDVAAAGLLKKRTFKKFSFKGVDLDNLLDMSTDELVKLFGAHVRYAYKDNKV